MNSPRQLDTKVSVSVDWIWIPWVNLSLTDEEKQETKKYKSLLFIIEESKKMGDPAVGLYGGFVKKVMIK